MMAKLTWNPAIHFTINFSKEKEEEARRRRKEFGKKSILKYDFTTLNFYKLILKVAF